MASTILSHLGGTDDRRNDAQHLQHSAGVARVVRSRRRALLLGVHIDHETLFETYDGRVYLGCWAEEPGQQQLDDVLVAQTEQRGSG